MKKCLFFLLVIFFIAAPVFAKAETPTSREFSLKIGIIQSQLHSIESIVRSLASFLKTKNLPIAAVANSNNLASVSFGENQKNISQTNSSNQTPQTPVGISPAESSPSEISESAIIPKTAIPPVQNPYIVKLVLTTAPQTVFANASSSVMTVQSQNSDGGSEKATLKISLSFTSSSPTGLFSNANSSGCSGSFGANISLNISSGDANKNFCYQDSTPGVHTITVSAVDYPYFDSAVQQVIIVGPGDANKDGVVDCLDYIATNTGFLNQKNLSSVGWENGDFNGDGKISYDDFKIINAAFLNSNSQSSCRFSNNSPINNSQINNAVITNIENDGASPADVSASSTSSQTSSPDVQPTNNKTNSPATGAVLDNSESSSSTPVSSTQ